MASQQQVKDYLASWLQLGKPIRVGLQQEPHSISRVVLGEHYSPEFESLWRYIQSTESGECCLDGVVPTVEDLLTDQWEITDCSRCQMPVSLPVAGIASPECPCHDLSNWPNNELPQPRTPVDSAGHLRSIYHRLTHTSSD
ncbi:hypothetical protein [Acaryochloris marina]|uniref:hypothetical protein n=1 Tax=Acaryochloris marina TaxID=155978 RepID=UPI001BAEE792|nr:hypothetical protein [Acaryochloris marina]QUY44722.1 hypothetical protein I1H34_11885 [Acaryochloris marina S15]